MNETTPLKAIKEKCLDCCCGQSKEVKLCEIKSCPLFPYRRGKNPFRTKRVLTEEQKQRTAEILAKAREIKNKNKGERDE